MWISGEETPKGQFFDPRTVGKKTETSHVIGRPADAHQVVRLQGATKGEAGVDEPSEAERDRTLVATAGSVHRLAAHFCVGVHHLVAAARTESLHLWIWMR